MASHIPPILTPDIDKLREEAERAIHAYKTAALLGERVDDGSFREFLRRCARDSRDAFAVPTQWEDKGRSEPVKYSPTLDEWRNTEDLLEKLHFMDTGNVGVAVVSLPEGVRGGLKPGTSQYRLTGRKYEIRNDAANSGYLRLTLAKNGAYYRPTDKRKDDPCYWGEVHLGGDDQVDRQHLTTQFEGTYVTPVYCADKDVDSKEARDDYQLLPDSCIWPLSGNRLAHTKHCIPGLHTPWLYVSTGPNTASSMHFEDAGTYSFNVLLAGKAKVWTTVSPSHKEKFEQAVGEDLHIVEDDRVCDNWLRELSLFPTSKPLEDHGIHHCIFSQNARDVVITFPYAYHAVENSGWNVAEAVNYAGKYWDPARAKFCKRMDCSHDGGLSEKNFVVLREGEQQVPANTRRLGFSDIEIPPTTSQVPKMPTKLQRSSRAQEEAEPIKQRPQISRVTTKSQQETKPSSTGRRKANPGQKDYTLIQSPCQDTRASVQIHQDSQPKKGTSSWRTNLPRSSRSGEHAILGEDKPSTTEQKKRLLSWEKVHPYQLRPSILLNHFELHKTDSGTLWGNRDVETVTSLIIAFGSPEAFSQLQGVLSIIRQNLVALDDESPTTDRDVYLTRLLDRNDQDEAYLAIQHRVNLMMFAKEVDLSRDRQRNESQHHPTMSRASESQFFLKISTLVYENIMSKVYPHLSKSNVSRRREWVKMYGQLGIRYKAGKRWQKLVDVTAVTVLLLLPTCGSLNIRNSQVHFLSNGIFDDFYSSLLKYKGSLLKRLANELSRGVEIRGDGKLHLRGHRFAFEDASIDEIKSCFRQEDKVICLAQQLPFRPPTALGMES